MSEPVASPTVLSEALSSMPQVDVQPDGQILDDTTMNHLSYKATNKVPYIIDYFGLRDFYNSNEMVTEMAKELHLLFVQNDSETQIGQTKEMLDAMSQELNLQDSDAPIYRLRKMLELAKIKDRISQNEDAKLRMLADITRM